MLPNLTCHCQIDCRAFVHFFFTLFPTGLLLEQVILKTTLASINWTISESQRCQLFPHFLSPPNPGLDLHIIHTSFAQLFSPFLYVSTFSLASLTSKPQHIVKKHDTTFHPIEKQRTKNHNSRHIYMYLYRPTTDVNHNRTLDRFAF